MRSKVGRLVLLLFVGGFVWRMFSWGEALFSVSEFSRHVSQVNTTWEYVRDSPDNDFWQVSTSHRGDCEDFVLTVWWEWTQGHPRSRGWLVVTQDHAVGIVEADGFYVVSVGRPAYAVSSTQAALEYIKATWGDVWGWCELPRTITPDVGVRPGLVALLSPP